MSDELHEVLKTGRTATIMAFASELAKDRGYFKDLFLPEEPRNGHHYSMSMRSMPGGSMSDMPGMSMSGGCMSGSMSGPCPTSLYLPNLGVVVGLTDEKRYKSTTRKHRDMIESATLVPGTTPPPVMFTRGSPNDLNWGIEALGLEDFDSEAGTPVLVGHLDSGVDATHPAFIDVTRPFKSAIEHFAYIDDCGSVHKTMPFAAGWHGTHTAATIAGRFGKRLPRVGVANRARLASAVVFEENGDEIGATIRVLAGIDWALGLGVKVLNMGIQIPCPSPDAIVFMNRILKILRDKEVLPVCAIGNLGEGTSVTPGNCQQALSVGAAQEDLDVWFDSSSQQFPVQPDLGVASSVPDLIAPGANIVSALPANITSAGMWAEASGTSMAAAHISGLAALLFQRVPNTTVAAVQDAIIRSCTQTPDEDAPRQGYGIPNACRALQILTGQPHCGKSPKLPASRKR